MIMCLTLKSVISEDDIAFSHDNVEGIQKDVIDKITNISPLRLHQSSIKLQIFRQCSDVLDTSECHCGTLMKPQWRNIGNFIDYIFLDPFYIIMSKGYIILRYKVNLTIITAIHFI